VHVCFPDFCCFLSIHSYTNISRGIPRCPANSSAAETSLRIPDVMLVLHLCVARLHYIKEIMVP